MTRLFFHQPISVSPEKKLACALMRIYHSFVEKRRFCDKRRNSLAADCRLKEPVKNDRNKRKERHTPNEWEEKLLFRKSLGCTENNKITFFWVLIFHVPKLTKSINKSQNI